MASKTTTFTKRAKIGHMHCAALSVNGHIGHNKSLRVRPFCKHMTEDVKQSRPKESHQLTDVHILWARERGGGGVRGRGSP